MRLVVALPGYSALRLRLVDAPSADAATAERQRTTRTVWWTGPGAPLSAGPADESTPR
jgi:hypothetical protein